MPAYTVEGYIASTTFEGTCIAQIFEDFIIDQVLLLCNEYPNPRSVIVLDNASIYHKQRGNLEAVCLERGVMLRFLPLYSPDFNPIEESFTDLKAYIRRWYRKERKNHTIYQDFLK